MSRHQGSDRGPAPGMELPFPPDHHYHFFLKRQPESFFKNSIPNDEEPNKKPTAGEAVGLDAW